MPKFNIVGKRTVTHTTNFTVTATDEDSAEGKADDFMAGSPRARDADDNLLEWEDDDEEFEVMEITEE